MMPPTNDLSKALSAANAIIGQQADEMADLSDRAQLLEASINGAIPQLRHLYWMMVNGEVDDPKGLAVELLAPQIVALESAQEAARRI